ATATRPKQFDPPHRIASHRIAATITGAGDAAPEHRSSRRGSNACRAQGLCPDPMAKVPNPDRLFLFEALPLAPSMQAVSACLLTA
ncbi:hypothetical protein, partial [Xanthomonas campestris]|uniref:hypothetical protein n=1 Tax=Xanthomonas campestris TaxID=339 RepID=UPI0039C29F21